MKMCVCLCGSDVPSGCPLFPHRSLDLSTAHGGWSGYHPLLEKILGGNFVSWNFIYNLVSLMWTCDYCQRVVFFFKN